MDRPKEAGGVSYLSHEEALALLDRQARKYLGMSGQDFAREYNAGRLDREESRVIRVSFLLTMARPREAS